MLMMRITELLLQCGVRNEDTAVVYCGLEENEAPLAVLVEELKCFFAPGNLIMPAGNPEFEKAGNVPFCVQTTPSCEGALSELFRKSGGVVRSLHPAGSLAAWGRDSAWLMEGHEKCVSSFSAASPWWKIFQKSGKCIFIACGLERSGIIAAAEEWAGCDVLSKRFYRRRIKLDSGKNRRVRIRKHLKGHRTNYPKIAGIFRDKGVLSRNSWNGYEIMVMNVETAVSLLLPFLRKNPRFFAMRRSCKNLKIV